MMPDSSRPLAFAISAYHWSGIALNWRRRYWGAIGSASGSSGRTVTGVALPDRDVLRRDTGLACSSTSVRYAMSRSVGDTLTRSNASNQARLSGLEEQYEEVGRRLRSLYDALETGKLDLDDLAPRIKELREKRSLVERARAEAQGTLAARKVELISREMVMDYLGDLKGVFDYGAVRKAGVSAVLRPLHRGPKYRGDHQLHVALAC